MNPFDAVFVGGFTADGEPMMVLATEQPQPTPGFTGRITKDVLERIHLERFRGDYLLRHGHVPFEEVRVGPNPPDFIVVGEVDEALDCAAFAVETRRLGYRLVDHLRRRLLDDAGTRDFSGVRDSVVTVTFFGIDEYLPPKRTDDGIVEPLRDTIASLHIDREAVARFIAETARDDQMPDRLPVTVATTPDGLAHVTANPIDASQLPSGPLVERFGFGLTFNMPHQHRIGELTPELQRLVTQHDYPTIEHLLVTAGGPDVDGIRYPSEEALAAFLLDHAPGVVAKHISRVTMHLWQTTEVRDIAVR